jgi:ketosteroid isomerase-like protein
VIAAPAGGRFKGHRGDAAWSGADGCSARHALRKAVPARQIHSGPPRRRSAENGRNVLNCEDKKKRANDMMRAMDAGNWEALEDILSDTFHFDLATPAKEGAKSLLNRQEFLDQMRSELLHMFPRGFGWEYKEALCEGDHVSLQAVSHTVTSKGKAYSNRYHWYYHFVGDKIDLLRVYLDSLKAYQTCVVD